MLVEKKRQVQTKKLPVVTLPLEVRGGDVSSPLEVVGDDDDDFPMRWR